MTSQHSHPIAVGNVTSELGRTTDRVADNGIRYVSPTSMQAGNGRSQVGPTNGNVLEQQYEQQYATQDHQVLEVQPEQAIQVRRPSDRPTATKVPPVGIQACDIVYSVGKSKTRKTILHNINANITPGHMVALMGASGAGKTTFLNVLSGSIRCSGGEVQVNNRKMKLNAFKRLSAFIPQDDTLLDSLTASEVFGYTARLRMPASTSKAKREEKVRWVMQKLSLLDCADTRIGNVGQRGMSGGQRKRVSIGLELLVDPSVLFVDEATSGLDSKMASDVLRMLRDLAEEGRTVICTIHQPSYMLFCLFHELILLSKGHLVYHGPTMRTKDYFTIELGAVMPENENPADVFMRVLQEHEGDDGIQTTDFAAIWQSKQQEYLPPSTPLQRLVGIDDSGSGGSGTAVSSWQQFTVLTERCLYDSLKDKNKLMQGLSLKFIVGLMLGIVFINQAGTTQASAFTTEGSMFFLCFASVMNTIFPTIMVFPQTRVLVVREYRNRYYNIAPYFCAQLLCNLLLHCFYGLFMAVPAYYLVGLNSDPEKFLIFLAGLLMLSCIGVTLGIAVGSKCDTVDDGPKMILPLLMPMMLFSGFLVPYSEIPFYFRWLYHLSFFQYSLNIFLVNQFESLAFTDCGGGAVAAQARAAAEAAGASVEAAVEAGVNAAAQVAGAMMCNITEAAGTLVSGGSANCAVRINMLTSAMPDNMPAMGCFETGEQYLSARNIDSSEMGFNFGILTVYFVVTAIGAYFVFKSAIMAKAQSA